MAKLFLTGATGYIGGDALFAIAKNFPELEITALVRNSSKGAKVASQYPKVRLVYGDLNNTDLLRTEAAKTDIVVHTANCDHVGAANALVAGLAERQERTYLIHTSGTGLLAIDDAISNAVGENNEKIYNDWDGLGEVTSLPIYAPHRPVDKIILAASEKSTKIHSAIVCPPCIYGLGRGPDNTRSVQIYNLARAVLKRGKGFVVARGLNRWAEVHVQDLSELYSALIRAALNPDGSQATWNKEGYYFAESGESTWGDVSRQLAKVAHEMKLIRSLETDTVSSDEANRLGPAGAFLWGMNSRSKAIRAIKLLGWAPKQKSMTELLPEVVESEAKSLGVLKTHAQTVATGTS